MLAILFWFAVFFIVHTYILYPLILFLLTTGRKLPAYATPNEWPSVSIIIAAHNEEAIIREKIENTIWIILKALWKLWLPLTDRQI